MSVASVTSQTRKRIGIVYGGRSVEHEISVLTALEAADAIDTTRYDPVLVYIDLRGRWWTGDALKGRAFYRAFHDRPDSSKAVVDEVTPVVTGAVEGRVGGLVQASRGQGIASAVSSFVAKRDSRRAIVPVDVWMPLLHGTLGEDGSVQGLFEFTQLPYTGCGVRAAAIGMSKSATKTFARERGVPVLPWIVLDSGAFASKDPARILERLAPLGPWPLFVKPVCLGSSVAVARAGDAAGLIAALVAVFQRDTQAIVEPCVVDLAEINVSVRRVNGGPIASVVEMPVRRSHSGALTYEDKYLGPAAKKGAAGAGMATMARVTDPKDLPVHLKDAARAHACAVYDALDCRGVSRLDFLLDRKTGELWFNEINTLPGSLAHYLWAASVPSITYTDLLGALIDEAQAEHQARARLSRDFGFRALK